MRIVYTTLLTDQIILCFKEAGGIHALMSYAQLKDARDDFLMIYTRDGVVGPRTERSLEDQEKFNKRKRPSKEKIHGNKRNQPRRTLVDS